MMAACGGQAGEEAASTNASGKEISSMESFERIKNMEDSVYNQQKFDPRGVHALHDVYKAHLNRFSSDTITPHILFRSASTSRQLNMAQEAIDNYDRILSEFPDWYRVADAAYMKAFTLDDKLGQKDLAEKAYKDVIANYPDHQFARDAQAMLENLHLSDEELIRKFEEMNKKQSN